MRVDHWEHALTHWANAQVGKPFVWGETDCASLVRQALAVMYGRDLFPGLAPWTTVTEAVRTIADGGAERLLALGAAVVPVNFEWAGDILMWEQKDEDALPGFGVLFATNLLMTDPSTGVVAPPTRMLTTRFRHAATTYRVPLDG